MDHCFFAGKRAYKKNHVRQKIAHILKSEGYVMYSYKCEHCREYHLTTSKPRDSNADSLIRRRTNNGNNVARTSDEI